jgi:hypothetical protein
VKALDGQSQYSLGLLNAYDQISASHMQQLEQEVSNINTALTMTTNPSAYMETIQYTAMWIFLNGKPPFTSGGLSYDPVYGYSGDKPGEYSTVIDALIDQNDDIMSIELEIGDHQHKYPLSTSVFKLGTTTVVVDNDENLSFTVTFTRRVDDQLGHEYLDFSVKTNSLDIRVYNMAGHVIGDITSKHAEIRVLHSPEATKVERSWYSKPFSVIKKAVKNTYVQLGVKMIADAVGANEIYEAVKTTWTASKQIIKSARDIQKLASSKSKSTQKPFTQTTESLIQIIKDAGVSQTVINKLNETRRLEQSGLGASLA